MLDTHRHVKDHGEFEVFLRDPGWEFTPVMLGKVASFIVRRDDGEWALFAFMYSMLLQLDGIDTDESKLLNQALETIAGTLDSDAWTPRVERTFEYRPDCFTEVEDPHWWTPTAG